MVPRGVPAAYGVNPAVRNRACPVASPGATPQSGADPTGQERPDDQHDHHRDADPPPPAAGR